MIPGGNNIIIDLPNNIREIGKVILLAKVWL